MVLTFKDYLRQVSALSGSSAIVWETFVALASGTGPWAVRAYHLREINMPELMDVLIAVVVLAVLEGGRRWFEWRRVGYRIYREVAERADEFEHERDEAAKRRDRELLAYLNEQRIVLIRDLRDSGSATAPNTYSDFTNWQRSVGRWFGRNEYLASQLADRFPTEVNRFLVYGDSDLEFDEGPTQMDTSVNHTKALITAKAGRFSELIASLQRKLDGGGSF
jgi:hypothetical protein